MGTMDLRTVALNQLEKIRNKLMSQCRICGSAENVISYDPRWTWAYPIRKTYCPEHCPEHDYNRHRDGTYCDICGQEPPYDYYED